MTAYIIGRRVGVAQPASDRLSRNIGPTSSLRAENSVNIVALRILGWGAATFGAASVLGWVATRKSSVRGPEDDAS
ncbi:hypothetical protein LDB30_06370 [Acidithiobacillus ferrooxidans]|nr:hypothetical protein LDB30_06370 [Acidithiobacillus ferrooxidans]